jgi:hypothetical protein
LGGFVVQENPGDGLVLTRGPWSWDVQEQRHYQFTGLMQYEKLNRAKPTYFYVFV